MLKNRVQFYKQFELFNFLQRFITKYYYRINETIIVNEFKRRLQYIFFFHKIKFLKICFLFIIFKFRFFS